MKNQPGRRSWIVGAIRAARAAAFLTLATGINGTIAALEPRYEAIYVYLVAIVIVAWLGGVLLGVTTAVVAIVLYDSMFSPLQAGPSWSSAVPFVIAVGAAVVTRLARAPLDRSRLSPPPARPLLQPLPAVVVEPAPPEDTAELDDLRIQLADAGRQLDDARSALDKESRLRAEATANARARLTALQHELDGARNDALEQARRAAALHGQLDLASGSETASKEQIEVLRRELGTSNGRLEEVTRRLDETTQELEVAWRRVDEEKAHSDSEARRLTDLERQANDALQRAVADLAARYQKPLAEAKASLEDAFTRIPLIEKERDDARASAGETAARELVLQQEVDRVRTLLDEQSARADRETSVREENERASREAVRIARDLAAAEAARVASLEGDLARERETARVLRAEHQKAVTQFDSTIADIATKLTSDYESVLGDATVEREAARADARALTLKVASLQQQIAALQGRITSEEAGRVRDEAVADYSARLAGSEARAAALAQQVEHLQSQLGEATDRAEVERAEHQKAIAEFDGKIASIAAGLTADYESVLGDATVEREGARAEARALASKVTSLEQKLAAARAEHQNAVAGFDRQIGSIVANITSDHENAIADAMVEREAARAEARALNKKLEAVQAKFLELNQFHEQVERTTSELRLSVENERRRADQQTAERERLESEWSAKLQSIVTNIAGDHESDLGDALVEREAARAETRELKARVKTLQQKLDLERHRGGSVEPVTLSGTTPRPALILVVHSDAGTRAMSKHALEQAGYGVLTAADGLEGLRVAAAQRPDVVLTEAVMPKMNGRELVQLLKARSETAGIKVVLMSSQSGSDAATDFRADDFLPTPTDVAALRATISRLLP